MEESEERQPPDVITSDTNNATKIEPKEAPAHKREKFRKFRAYNTGTWNGPKRENKEVTHRQDNLHRYDSISSTLSLTDYQKSRGRQIVDDIDAGDFGLDIDALLFGICVVVANESINDGTRYWPKPSEHQDSDSLFDEFAQSLGYDWKKQMSLIKKVRSEM